MKIGNFMCVLIGGFLSLSQSFGLYAKGLDTPTVGVSTAELDGFSAKTQSVEVYEYDFISGFVTPKELLRSFKYDSLGRRIEYRDGMSSLIYKYGYDRRGNHVRTSVYHDTIKERMRDTIFFYDSNNRLTKKRISYWGEWLETENLEYDSLGNLLTRNLYSETGNRSLRLSETYRYDAKNRMVAFVKRDFNNQASSKAIWIYDKEDGRLKEKREEENGFILHDYKYTYDEKGNLTEVEDMGKIGVQVTKTIYYYDSVNRLLMERLYGRDGVWLGEKSYSYHLNGRVKKIVELKLRIVPLLDEVNDEDWNRTETSYDPQGRKIRYEHYSGKGDLYAVYDDVEYNLLKNRMLYPSSKYTDYAIKKHIVMNDTIRTIRRREKILVDEPEPLQKVEFVYGKGGCKRCTAYWGGGKVTLLMKYDSKNRLTESVISDAYGQVDFQTVFRYDKEGNMTKRLAVTPCSESIANTVAIQFREHLDSVGLFDRYMECKYEYWK